MVAVELDIINDEIECFGETISIIKVSANSLSDWGDDSQTTSSITAKAVYNVYGRGAVYQTEGEFQEGAVTFFVKSGVTSITVQSKIVRSNGDRYLVRDTRDHGIEGNTYVQELSVQKV